MPKSHPIIAGKRHCAHCKQTLPVSAFNHLKRSATGLDYHCRACRQKAKVDVYHRQAIKVSDLREMMLRLFDEKAFTCSK